MKISNNWLKDYITTDLRTEKIADYLTDIGLVVEGTHRYESVKGSLQGIVVGKVLSCEAHPNADKLKKTTVDIGKGTILNIVCGAPNVAAGQTVPVAVAGAKIYNKTGDFFEIKKTKIRGEVSEGMICAEDELGLSDEHGGIMVLDPSYEAGQPLSKYIATTHDEVFEIGLTPNRTDAMSHYGVARDLHAFLVSNAYKSDFKKFSAPSFAATDSSGFTVEVEDNNLVPRYIGAVIENITVAESPNWLKDRLKAIGLSPINNIVDITNYILHGYGQPLHAFDADKIQGSRVVAGMAPAGTKFTTLDGVERTLNGTEIVIKDGAGKPMCLAGVFGGISSGITMNTKTIFLESAYFNPVAIRKAAKYHGLNTDASFRFERGVDPSATQTILAIAVKMIMEVAGGQLRGAFSEVYPEKVKPHYIVFRYSKLDQILGVKIHREKVKEILKSLDIIILNEITNGLELQVPPYRTDVTREIDVIEEVLRIYGYNKIETPKKLSFTPGRPSQSASRIIENHWAATLVSLGFNEVMNNSLTSVKDETDAVKLLNPLSNELSFMRKSLLEGLLENANFNINRKNKDLKFFEIGKIYHRKASPQEGILGRYEERNQLALLVSGRNEPENWVQPKSSSDFFRLKAYIALIFNKLNIELEERASKDIRFSEAIEWACEGKKIAVLGKIAPQLLKNYDVEQDCFYAEVETDAFAALLPQGDMKFVEVPKFNKIRRDLALMLDNSVTYADLYKAAKLNPSKYIKSINLFDVYEGKNLPEGKKSYALSFELLNEDKTLEEKEIAEVMTSLIHDFKEKFNAELR